MALLVRRWTLVIALASLLLPVVVSGAPVRSDELVVADATAPPATLDPFKVYGTQAQSFFRLIFEPLFDRDADGKIREATMEPVSPLTDFSFDFQDLRLKPVGKE